jgi:hypothetical protein
MNRPSTPQLARPHKKGEGGVQITLMDPPFPQEGEKECFSGDFGKTVDVGLTRVLGRGVAGETTDLEDSGAGGVGDGFLTDWLDHHGLEVLGELVHGRRVLAM